MVDHFIANLPDVTEGFIQVPMQPKHLRKAHDLCIRSKQIRIISRDPLVPSKVHSDVSISTDGAYIQCLPLATTMPSIFSLSHAKLLIESG
jgi:hypothetical protein